MIIKVLGTGCARCKSLESKVREVAEAQGVDAEIEKVTDIQEIMKYGIMATPGLVINEKVKCSGIIPNDDELIQWFKEC
ncbi:MAG: thioredoxin family protein [Ignavibacteriaceae bacterium]|nr:thioredoxin family protein [Ignavibacteriaceae bacterium]